MTAGNQLTAGKALVGDVQFKDGGDKAVRMGSFSLAAVATAGGGGSWANPTNGNIRILSVQADVTTFTVGACTLDIGVAANATTLSATLIDGLNAATAVQVADSSADAGATGGTGRTMTSSQFVTVSQASGAIAGLAGTVYITYAPI